jgi:hypothetical protein
LSDAIRAFPSKAGLTGGEGDDDRGGAFLYFDRDDRLFYNFYFLFLAEYLMIDRDTQFI